MLRVLPGAGDVSEGQDVTLVCSVARGTPPISFAWFHTETEGALFSQTSEELKGSFSISNVRGEQRGQYYCVGNNPANATKRSLIVTIGGVPHLQLRAEMTVMFARQGHVER